MKRNYCIIGLYRSFPGYAVIYASKLAKNLHCMVPEASTRRVYMYTSGYSRRGREGEGFRKTSFQ